LKITQTIIFNFFKIQFLFLGEEKFSGEMFSEKILGN